jgi:hypothetical protein
MGAAMSIIAMPSTPDLAAGNRDRRDADPLILCAFAVIGLIGIFALSLVIIGPAALAAAFLPPAAQLTRNSTITRKYR